MSWIESNDSRYHYYVSSEPLPEYIPFGKKYICRKKRTSSEIFISSKELCSWIKVRYCEFCGIDLKNLREATNKIQLHVVRPKSCNKTWIPEPSWKNIYSGKMQLFEYPPIDIVDSPKPFLNFVKNECEIYGLELIRYLTVEYNYLEMYFNSLLYIYSYNKKIYYNAMYPSAMEMISHDKIHRFIEQ